MNFRLSPDGKNRGLGLKNVGGIVDVERILDEFTQVFGERWWTRAPPSAKTARIAFAFLACQRLRRPPPPALRLPRLARYGSASP